MDEAENKYHVIRQGDCHPELPHKKALLGSPSRWGGHMIFVSASPLCTFQCSLILSIHDIYIYIMAMTNSFTLQRTPIMRSCD